MDLATYLNETGISQAQFARVIEADPTLVWQWLHGHRPIAPRWAIPIEKATNGRVSRHAVAPGIYPQDEARAS